MRRRSNPSKIILLLSFVLLSSSFSFLLVSSLEDEEERGEELEILINANSTVLLNKNDSARTGDSSADMIDRALEKEFTESNEDQVGGDTDAGSFNNSVAEQQAVLETVARVRIKKNDTKEEKYVFFL